VLETPAIEGAKLREMVADGLLDEIVITWRPCLSGGPAAPMTGMDATFLPRGVRLELAGIRRRGGECVARYRVQTDRQ
jgi:riboflavin biosynthesis pyrimidine reductase